MKLVIFYDKHGPTYYLAENETKVDDIFLHVFNERLEECWYSEEETVKVRSDLDIGKISSVRRFMYSRINNEYENYEVQNIGFFS
jgi:hypothetical protein